MQQKISEFINHALFDEKHGYYKQKNPIGKDADFITAPEISQVFGELLAAYILHLFSQNPVKTSVVEMGAGKGTLFFDILLSINKLAQKNNQLAQDFLQKNNFHIIEINQALLKIQKDKLQDFKITWHENFDDFLAKKDGEILFFSNEFFDCFAIDQYQKTDLGWHERLIEDNQKFVTAKFNPEIHKFVENLIGTKKSQKAPFGAIFEYSADAKNFMNKLSNTVKTAIIIDYGYIKQEFANTLQAIRNHKKVSIFENIGAADITALVDFSLLEKIAKECKLSSSIITQGEFLKSLGIKDRRNSLIQDKNSDEIKQINSAINRLIDEDQMGELFKCLIIWK